MPEYAKGFLLALFIVVTILALKYPPVARKVGWTEATSSRHVGWTWFRVGTAVFGWGGPR